MYQDVARCPCDLLRQAHAMSVRAAILKSLVIALSKRFPLFLAPVRQPLKNH
jgi:hypothetical protein